MTKIIISGISGRLGTTLRDVVNESPEYKDFQVVAGFDITDGHIGDVPVFSSPGSRPDEVPEADVVIDFSNYLFIPELLRYCTETKTPAVIATTALGEAEIEILSKAISEIPVFRSANMSLGVNLVAKMAGLAAPVIEDSFNIEIIEAHHNRKKDAPSGTAILLADAINGALDRKKGYIYGRHGREAAPSIGEIGIHAIRGGTIPGQHTVLFAGPDEVLEIKHTVYSTKVFAIGALKAAAFIKDKPPGLYDMNSLIG